MLTDKFAIILRLAKLTQTSAKRNLRGGLAFKGEAGPLKMSLRGEGHSQPCIVKIALHACPDMLG